MFEPHCMTVIHFQVTTPDCSVNQPLETTKKKAQVNDLTMPKSLSPATESFELQLVSRTRVPPLERSFGNAT